METLSKKDVERDWVSSTSLGDFVERDAFVLLSWTPRNLMFFSFVPHFPRREKTNEATLREVVIYRRYSTQIAIYEFGSMVSQPDRCEHRSKLSSNPPYLFNLEQVI
jgi:hypothetical protein